MNILIEEAVNNLKLNGFHIIREAIPSESLEYLEASANTMRAFYSEEAVKDRLFYRREDSYNRQGDALMVSLSEETELPSVHIFGRAISKYFKLYNNILEASVGVKFSSEEEMRSMMNIQEYFEKSLPVWDHYDGEFLEYHHEVNPKNNEKILKIDKALIPRLVMVVVVRNDNNGKGVYVRKHDSEERIDIELYPGDILIFDNISMRHGVPELEKPRMMFGFRNFDYFPYYFEANPEGGNNWTELHDTLNPGWIMKYTPADSKEEQLKFIKKWKEKLYVENLEQCPAF